MKDLKPQVVQFLKNFKDGNIPDEKVHALADKLGISPHEIESIFYKLAAQYVNTDSVEGGKGDEAGTTSKDVNADELRVGIAVEKEHSGTEKVASEIAIDHLTENPKYYTELIASGIVDEKEALDIAKELGWKIGKSMKKEGKVNISEGNSPILKVGDTVKIVSKLMNAVSRSFFADKSGMPQVGQKYKIIKITPEDYYFKDNSGDIRLHTIKWIDKEISRKNIVQENVKKSANMKEDKKADNYRKFLNWIATEKITNPDTGRVLKIKDALNYSKTTSVYKLAKVKADEMWKKLNVDENYTSRKNIVQENVKKSVTIKEGTKEEYYKKFLDYITTAKMKNPVTGKLISIKSALSYPKSSPVYALARAKADAIYKGDKVSETRNNIKKLVKEEVGIYITDYDRQIIVKALEKSKFRNDTALDNLRHKKDVEKII